LFLNRAKKRAKFINIIYLKNKTMKILKDFIFEEYSQTIRTVPENYWIATIKNGKLIFDSWDGAIVGRYSKIYVWLLWKLKCIPKK
jgi:hypothetical protein